MIQNLTITKIEQAIIILQEAKEGIPGNERFYNERYAKVMLNGLILQLEGFIQNAKDTNEGLTAEDVLQRKFEVKQF